MNIDTFFSDNEEFFSPSFNFDFSNATIPSVTNTVTASLAPASQNTEMADEALLSETNLINPPQMPMRHFNEIIQPLEFLNSSDPQKTILLEHFPRLFSHFFGDSFIKGLYLNNKELEGLDTTPFLQFMHTVLQKYPSHSKFKLLANDLPKALNISLYFDQQIERLTQIRLQRLEKMKSEKTTGRYNFGDDSEYCQMREDFANKITTEISGLETNTGFNSLLMPAGWTTSSGGHEIYCEIIRTSISYFTLRLYNVGDESQFQTRLTTFQETPQKKIYHHVFPFLELETLTLEEITTPTAWEIFFEYRVRSKHCPYLTGVNYCVHFLKAIRPNFNIDSNITSSRYQIWKKIQKSGTCVYKSFSAYCLSKLTKSEWRRLKLDIRLYLLEMANEYFNYALTLSASDLIYHKNFLAFRDAPVLVLRGLKKFVKSVQKDFRNNTFALYDAELNQILKITGATRDVAEKTKEKFKYKPQKIDFTKPTIPLDVDLSHIIKADKERKTASLEVTPKIEEENNSTGLSTSTDSQIPQIPESWKKDIQSIHLSLMQFIENSEKLKKNYDHAYQFYLENLLNDLPPVDPLGSEPIFWRKLDKAHIPSVMQSITTLSENLLGSISMRASDAKTQPPPFHLYLQQKCLAILHQLYHFANQEYMGGAACDLALPFLTHRNDFIHSSKCSDFHISNPALENDVKITIEYLLSLGQGSLFTNEKGEVDLLLKQRISNIIDHELIEEKKIPEINFMNQLLTSSPLGEEISRKLVETGSKIWNVPENSIEKNLIITLALADLNGTFGVPTIYCALKKQYIITLSSAIGSIMEGVESPLHNAFTIILQESGGQPHPNLIFFTPRICAYVNEEKKLSNMYADLGHFATGDEFFPVKQRVFGREKVTTDPFSFSDTEQYGCSYFTEESGNNQNSFLTSVVPDDCNEEVGTPLMPLDKFRQYVLLGNPDDKSFQILKTMNYFNKNPLDLLNDECCDFCYCLIFEPGLLTKSLKTIPSMPDFCINFCQNGFKFFNEQLKLTQSLFFIKMSYAIEGYFRYLNLSESVFSEDFNSPIQMYEKLLERNTLTDDEIKQIYIHELIYLLETEQISWETLPLIIRNTIKLTMGENSKYYNKKESDKALKIGLKAWQFIELEFCSHPEKSRLHLEKIILSEFKFLFESINFSLDFSNLPKIKSSDNLFSYDISKGIYSFEGQHCSKLPSSCYDETLIPVKELSNIIFKSGEYHFIYEGRKYIVQMQPSIIHYEYEQANSDTDNTQKIIRSEMNLSHSYFQFFENKKYRPIYSKRKLLNDVDLDYSYLLIRNLNEAHGWIDEQETEILFLQYRTHKPLFKLNLHTKQIINCEPNSFKNGWILGNREKYPFTFHKFDRFYEIWVDAHNQIQYISFPLYDLNFRFEHGLATSFEFPGYFIHDNFHADLPRLASILVLKNAQNEMKVIIPESQISSSSSSLNLQGTIKITQFFDEKFSPFYVYSSVENQILFNREVKANLFLCYLFLLHQNHESAWKALKLSHKLFRYIGLENSFFHRILDYAKLNNEPNLLAISLHAAYMWLTNMKEHIKAPFNGTEAKIFYRRLISIYNKYTEQIDHVENYLLSNEQRLFLLQSLVDNFEEDSKLDKDSKHQKDVLNLEIEFIKKEANAALHMPHWSQRDDFDLDLNLKPEFKVDKNICLDLIEREKKSSKGSLKIASYLGISKDFISNNFLKLYRLSQDLNSKHYRTILMLPNIQKGEKIAQNIYQCILNQMTICKPLPEDFKHPSYLEAAIKDNNIEGLQTILNKIFTEALILNSKYPANSYQPHPIKHLLNHSIKVHHINILTTLPFTPTTPLTFSLYDTPTNHGFLPLLPFNDLLNHLSPRNQTDVISEQSAKKQTFETIQEAILKYNERVSLYMESLNKDQLDEAKKNKFNRVINKEIERYQEEIKVAFNSYEFDSHYFNPQNGPDLLSHLNVLSVTCGVVSVENINKIGAFIYKRNVPGFELLRMDLDAALNANSIDFEALIPLYQSANPNEYLKKFPYLNPNEIREFDQLIEKEIIIRTHLQHISRAKKIIQEIMVKYTQPAPNDPEYQILSRKLLKELTCSRNYAINPNPDSNIQSVSPSQFRTFLLIEYFQSIMLWPEQIASLKILTESDPQALVQLKTGSGKSKVFFPILAFTKANGTNLSIIMVLNELMKVDSRDIQLINEKTFGQKGNRINWNNVSLNGLIHIENKLEEIIENREFLLVTTNEMHLFMLRFTSLKLNYQKATERQISNADLSETVEKLEYFTRILAILKEKGDLPIDEIDSALYCRFKFNVPHGKMKFVDQNRHELACFIFENLLTDPMITSQLNFEFSKRHSPGSQPASIDNIQQIKSHFVKRIVQQLNTPALLQSQSSLSILASYMQNLEPLQQNVIIDYLLNDPKYNQNELLIVSSESQIIADLLALLKQQIKTLWTVTKDYKVNYGLSKSFGHILAGPFGGANKPRLKSQFGNDIELIFYTIQSYLINGLPQEIIEGGIDKLRNKAIEEACTHMCQISETQAYKKFQLICNYNEFNFFILSDPEMKKIVKLINDSLETSLIVIREFILPEVKSYSGQIQSNAFMLLDMFKSIQGVTASPWNIDILKHVFNFHPSQGSDGQALLSIIHNNPNAVYFYDDGSKQKTRSASQLDEDVEMITGVETKIDSENKVKIVDNLLLKQKSLEMLEQFIKSAPPKTHALIDVGALFKNLNNDEAAECILKIRNKNTTEKPLQGIVYFSENDEQMILKLNGKKQNFQKGELSIDEYFVFFDQKHTTGMDFEFTATAQAIVTFNKNSIFKEIMQGAGRLRKLLEGQRTIFMGLKSDADLIKKEIHKDEGSSLNKIDLLLYFIIKQGKQLSSDNIISLKQTLNTALYKLSRSITRTLSIQELTCPEMVHLEKLFVTLLNESAFLEYGMIEEFEDSQAVLNNWKNQVLRKLYLFLKKWGARLSKTPIMEEKPTQRFKRMRSEDPDSNHLYCDDVNYNQELNNFYFNLQSTLDNIIEKFLECVPEKIESESYESETTLEVEEEEETEYQIEVENCHENTNSRLGYWSSNIKHASGSSKWKNIELLFNVENYFSARSNSIILTANECYKNNNAFIKIFKEKVLFDDGLYVSAKFLHTVNTIEDENEPDKVKKVDSFFDYYHKNVGVFLVIKPKGLNAKLKIVLLSAQESEVLNAFLISDRIKNLSIHNAAIKARRQYQICLYLNDIGIVQQGADPIAPEELENAAFKRLLVQAKFINKEINYNKNEQEVIKKWLHNFTCIAIESLERAFVTVALEWDEYAQKNYSTSSLAQTFKNIFKDKGSSYKLTQIRRKKSGVESESDETGEED